MFIQETTTGVRDIIRHEREIEESSVGLTSWMKRTILLNVLFLANQLTMSRI